MNYQGKDIYYKVDGDLSSDRNIIVILNGIMMSTSSWEQFKASFTENNTLVRFDMLDQGQSSKADKQYTQEIQVDILYHLLEELGIKKMNLVGISYGASVALQFAIKHQEYIDKLIVANVVMKTSPWLKAIGDGWNEVGRSRNGLAYYNISIPYIYSPLFYSKHLDWMEKRKEVLLPIFSNPVFLDAMERLTISAETHDTSSELHKIKSDTLIISSEYDYLTPMFEQVEIQKRIEGSHLVVLPACGHASMYEEAEMFAALILGFINNTNIPRIL